MTTIQMKIRKAMKKEILKTIIGVAAIILVATLLFATCPPG